MASTPIDSASFGNRQIVCAWCGLVMREGPTPMAHGMCPACTALDLPVGPLTEVSVEELQRLPYGVIRLDGNGVITDYTVEESRHSRLDASTVVGRNFFTQVAPCTNVQAFEGRFEALRARGLSASERFAFEFRLPWGTSMVTLALTYDAVTDSAVLVIDWPPEPGAGV